MAQMAATNDKTLEAYKMAQVVCIQAIKGPTSIATINCAMKTMLLMMAISVPRPRFCLSGTLSPFRTRNCKQKQTNQNVK